MNQTVMEEARLEASGETPPPDRHRWLALAVILSAAFLGPLDFFIVNISIPSIQENLHASNADIEWLLAGYGLVYALFLITGGRLGDIYGRKRMFMLGVASFTLASALCGFAPNSRFLVAARFFQGFTASLMFPQVLSIIQVTFPPWERGKAFGLFGMMLGAGSFAGMLMGGFLLKINLFGLTWRPIFLVNLPVGIIALIATAQLVHESRSPRARRLDLVGVAIVTLGLLLLVYPLVQGPELHWPRWVFACLAAAVPVLIGFVLYEQHVSTRGGSPLMELGLFRDRVFVIGLVICVTFYGGIGVFFLAITEYLQEGLRFTPMETSITFAPFAVGFLVASNRAIRLTPILGSRVMSLGSVLMITGLLIVLSMASLLGSHIRPLELMPVLMLYGVGQGFLMPTLVTTVLSGIHTGDAGSASGVLTTVQQVAASMGVAVIGTVFFSVLGAHPAPAQFTRAIGAAFWCNISLLALTGGLVFLLPRCVPGHVPTAPVEI